MLLGSLASSNRCPRTNVPQIFYGNRSIRVFGFRDKLFRDAMIYVGLIAALATAHILEFTFCGARPDLLQSSAAVGVPLAFGFYLLAGITLAVAISGKFDDAEINAQNIINIAQRRLWNFAHGQQVKHAFAINKVGFADAGFKQSLLTLTANIRNLLPTGERPDAHELIVVFHDRILSSKAIAPCG
jgi:hypothetical protein